MIETFDDIDLRLIEGAWPFAETRRAEIDAHWAEKRASNPALWDGRVLCAFAPRLKEGVFSAHLVEIAFSAFLAWRDWGFPDTEAFNVFGSAVIAGNDGSIVLGVMAAHTANAGAIYPCGGSLEPGDVRPDGRIDIWGSIARELSEETGLDAAEAQPGGDFLSRSGQLLSVNRVFRFDLPGAALARRIEDNIAAQVDRELAGVVVLRRADDLDQARAPDYAVNTVRYLFEG